MDDVCEMCGNERAPGVSTCRFCGASNIVVEGKGKGGPVHRVVNIKHGKPFVDDAINKLKRELDRAHIEETIVLTIIHGYGSSGKGGAIRNECRKILEYLESRGEIKYFIPGEEFTKKNGNTRVLLRRCPQIGSNNNLNKGNRGVTLVVVN